MFSPRLGKATQAPSPHYLTLLPQPPPHTHTCLSVISAQKSLRAGDQVQSFSSHNSKAEPHPLGSCPAAGRHQTAVPTAHIHTHTHTHPQLCMSLQASYCQEWNVVCPVPVFPTTQKLMHALRLLLWAELCLSKLIC